jgi:hypothetical protein
MTTPQEIADWMLQEVLREGTVYQESIASDVANKFGEEFVPMNENGNPSVRRDILNAFRKISEDSVVWMRSERAWRKREEGDDAGRRQE